MTPNPGSPEAIEQGCKCPRYDNCHGDGYSIDRATGEPLFVIVEGCPIHDPAAKETPMNEPAPSFTEEDREQLRDLADHVDECAWTQDARSIESALAYIEELENCGCQAGSVEVEIDDDKILDLLDLGIFSLQLTAKGSSELLRYFERLEEGRDGPQSSPDE